MRLNKIFKGLAVAVAVCTATFFACNSFDSIDQPERVNANETFTIKAKLKIVPETEEKDAVLAFAMYAPKSMDLANNATVVFSTLNFAEVLGTDYGVVDVKDEVLTIIPADEKAPHSPFIFEGEVTQDQWIPWKDAFQSCYGDGDNWLMGIADQMEWVVWESKEHFYISDKLLDGTAHQIPLYAEVTITLNAGKYNQDCFLGYAYCNKIKGFYNYQDQLSDAEWRRFYVEGGINLEPEQPAEPVMTTIQSDFSYNDLFGIEFKAAGTALEGEENIYLCGKATYDGGQEVEVAAAVEANRLTPLGEGVFEKYIFPMHFFSLPLTTQMESFVVWFTNADGTKVVNSNSDGTPFNIVGYTNEPAPATAE